MDTLDHGEQLANLERLLADQRALTDRLDQRQAQQAERPVPPRLDPADLETTMAQVRRMLDRDTHPS